MTEPTMSPGEAEFLAMFDVGTQPADEHLKPAQEGSDLFVPELAQLSTTDEFARFANELDAHN